MNEQKAEIGRTYKIEILDGMQVGRPQEIEQGSGLNANRRPVESFQARIEGLDGKGNIILGELDSPRKLTLPRRLVEAGGRINFSIVRIHPLETKD